MKRTEWDPYLLDPPGVVGDVVKWIRESSGMDQPKFALAAGLTVCAALVGRAVKDWTGQRTNIYTLAVGNTSAGKNAPIRLIGRLVDALGQKKLIAGEACSASAIEILLNVFPVRLFLLDEVGHYIANMKTAGRSDVNLRTVIPALMKCWSCADGIYCGKVRAKDVNGKWSPPVNIAEPCVCLYGTTTPDTLFDGMGSADFADGSIPRFLPFISCSRPQFHACKDNVVPLELIEVMRKTLARCGVKQHESKTQSGALDDKPSAFLIPTDRVADSTFEEFDEFIHDRMCEADRGDKVNYVWGKAGENARRIALTLAAWRGEGDFMVGLCEADYAVQLVKAVMGEAVSFMRDRVSDSLVEKSRKDILRIIAGCGKRGISKSELTRKTPGMVRDRQGIIEDLLESEEIEMFSRKGTGAKLVTYYRIAGPLAE